MTNVVLAGIGGQGILTLASLIGNAALIEGYEVRLSEARGMAQRGGPVTCHVRFGLKVYSPLIMEGSADIIISLETSEALRVAQYLKPLGAAVLNDLVLPPPMAIIKGFQYPSLEIIVASFRRITEKIYVIRALEMAEKIGSLNVMNSIVLGAAFATGELEVSKNALVEAITSRFGEKWKDINVRAFEEGAKAVSEKKQTIHRLISGGVGCVL